jgi:hypothetical protein
MAPAVTPSLGAETLNTRVLTAEYAVRGEIVRRAQTISKELQSGCTTYPFDKVVYCNIGNPQILGQKPITYFRQVLSLCEYPEVRVRPTSSQAERPAAAGVCCSASVHAFIGSLRGRSPRSSSCKQSRKQQQAPAAHSAATAALALALTALHPPAPCTHLTPPDPPFPPPPPHTTPRSSWTARSSRSSSPLTSSPARASCWSPSPAASAPTRSPPACPTCASWWRGPSSAGEARRAAPGPAPPHRAAARCGPGSALALTRSCIPTAHGLVGWGSHVPPTGARLACCAGTASRPAPTTCS